MKYKFFLVLLFSATAFAQTESELITAPECIIPSLTETYGSRLPSTQRIYTTSKSEIGKEYQEGSVIYYAEYKEAEKFHYAQSDIKITNPSPLNRNYSLNKDGRLITQFSFKNKSGKIFDVVTFDESVWFVIDENGMMCNGGYLPGLNWSINNIFKNSVSPHIPFKSKIEQTKNQSQANITKAIAIQLVTINELQITFQTSKITDEKITENHKRSINALKGEADLGIIKVKFHIKNGKTFVLDEVTEITN